MSLTNIALYLYPIRKDQNQFLYIIFISLSFVIRSTTAIIWIPLVLAHLIDLYNRSKLTLLFTQLTPVAVVILTLTAVIDSYFYGQFVFVPFNFFKVNILDNVSSFFGVHPVYWYLTHAMPLYMGLPIFHFVFGLFDHLFDPKVGMFAKVTFWSLVIYSLIPHKEHRFLLPLIPLMTSFAALHFRKRNFILNRIFPDKLKVILILLIHIPIPIYFSLVDQIGSFSVIRHMAVNPEFGNETQVLFLTPCHPGPFYSHLHKEVPIRFLNCEPDLTGNPDYVEENVRFFENPVDFLKSELETWPDYIAIFDNIWPEVEKMILEKGFRICQRFFNTQIIQDRRGNNLYLLCKNQ